MPQAVGVGTGTQLSGIYELDERLGSGGMGEVYRGHNIQTGDPVAIKIVLPEFARDPAIFALFRKEASILNHLSHDAIVRYHVFTVDQAIGRPYLAMEFVNGESLAQVISRGPMPPENVWLLCERVASGLAAAHQAGVIHRDLSPDNIILPQNKVEKAKIIDFGIARSAYVGGETLLGGKFAGKYNYVSPEQLGLFGGDITERSDIYCLGLVLAAALRGAPVDMSGSQLEIVEKRRTVPDLAEIDHDFRPLLQAMLQPDPRDRPKTMAEVATYQPPAFSFVEPIRPAILTGRAVAPPLPTGKPVFSSEEKPAAPFARKPTPPPQHRRRVAAAALLATAVLAMLAGGVYYSGFFEEPQSMTEVTGSADRSDAVQSIEPDGPPSPGADSRAQEPTQPSVPETTARHEADVGNRLAWLKNYPGGDCFYVTATSATATELEGFGKVVEPFAGLQEAFSRIFGMAPEVGVRLIEPEQCGVTALLRIMGNSDQKAPELTLSQMAVPNGAEIRGRLHGLDGRKTDLILVDHRGTAYSLNGRLRGTGDDTTFSINIALTASDLANGKPLAQLIVALASPDGIKAARFTAPVPASDLFPRILSEVGSRELNAVAVAKYFRIGG